MPIITFNRKDFCKLVGRNFTKDKLEELMPMMGLEWEGCDGDEISVELFPNRPDLLCVEGLARAFKSYMGLKKGLINYDVKDSDYELIVDKSVKSVRPVIACAVVKGVRLSGESVKSLMQLQEKLHVTHARNRVKAAIGVHDLRAVKFPLRYTTVEPRGIKFIPLDSNKSMTPEVVLSEHPKGMRFAHLVNKFTTYPMILSANNEVLSFPPIINSELTKVRSKTTDLFIDVTGIDEFTVLKALNIITTSLIDRGAKVYSVTIREGLSKRKTPVYDNEVMVLNCNYCNKLLGVNLSAKRINGLLSRMGYYSEINDSKLSVKIPCYRTDILHPIDLVEDVAISYGYMDFDIEMPKVNTIGSELFTEGFKNQVRDYLVGNGYLEVITWHLTNEEVLFKKMNAVERPLVRILNPKTADYTVVRDYLTPSILDLLRENKHNDYPQRIFEVGEVLTKDLNESSGVRESINLCYACAHSSSNYTEVKGLLDDLMKFLGVKFSIKDVDNSSFIKGRVAEVIVNKESVGFIGELSPEVLVNHELKIPITICELNLSRIL